ncbi:MAG: hypothetical protein ACM3JI_00705 [Anaerolineae bacterium]
MDCINSQLNLGHGQKVSVLYQTNPKVQLTDQIKKSFVGRHVIHLKQDERETWASFLKIFAVACLILSGVGMIPLVKAINISKSLDAYENFKKQAEKASPPPSKKIFIKTEKKTFNHLNDYAISDQMLWYRPRNAIKSKWKPFYFDGSKEGRVPASIGADGANLIVIDDHREVHYKKVLKEKRDEKGRLLLTDKTEKDNWKDRWLSLPVLNVPLNLITGKKLKLPLKARAWAISQRGQFNHYCHDITGKKHPVSTGVTSFYLLDETGKKIYFADPWLPFGFKYEISGPSDKSFTAKNLSASASTLFLIGRGLEKKSSKTGGHRWKKTIKFYTRLADFDTTGQDPFLKSSFDKRDKDKDVRVLPAENWVQQPSIPLSKKARLTSHITIYQTGEGNAARMLHVQGTDKRGRSGYYYKKLQDLDPKDLDPKAWKFKRTGEKIKASDFLPKDKNISLPSKKRKELERKDLQKGVLRLREKELEVRIENLHAPTGGAIVTARVGQRKLCFELHTQQGFLNLLGAKKPTYHLVVPEKYFTKSKYQNNVQVRELMNEVFRSQRVRTVHLDEKVDSVEIII